VVGFEQEGGDSCFSSSASVALPDVGCGDETMPGHYVWIGLSAKTIANYFLTRSARDGVPIDPLKLQKLIYLAHGWSLVFLQRPLIKEPVEAWPYGPVVSSLYHEFKRFGASPITEHAYEAESTYGLDADTRVLLDAVWGKYRSLSPIQLSILTHEPGYAWDLTRKTGYSSPWGSPIIRNELIADEFVRRQQGRA